VSRPVPRRLVATTGLALALAGCGAAHPASALLGRPISSAAPAPAAGSTGSRVAIPAGDPPHERGGHIAPTAAAAQDRPARAALAPSPTGALTRYALAYTNWRASGLPARERQLAALAVGVARLSAEQTAAAQSGAAALATDHVANVGWVVAVAPGEGPDRGQWVVVTEEQTTGTGPYAGLPAGPHVTLARVVHLPGGWAVSAWDPIS
jgi:hypothetical protein